MHDLHFVSFIMAHSPLPASISGATQQQKTERMYDVERGGLTGGAGEARVMHTNLSCLSCRPKRHPADQQQAATKTKQEYDKGPKVKRQVTVKRCKY